MTNHITLIGDSVFDNAAYTGGAPDVQSNLRGLLPAGWEVTLCAVEGTTTDDVRRQFEHVPPETTRLDS